MNKTTDKIDKNGCDQPDFSKIDKVDKSVDRSIKKIDTILVHVELRYKLMWLCQTISNFWSSIL